MDIINRKPGDNGFVMSSIEQMSKIISISCQNKNSGKSDTRTDINRFHKTILMAIIDTPDVI